MPLSVPEDHPKRGQRWKRDGEPTRTVVSASSINWNPGVYFKRGPPTRLVQFEDWDEWMWWASDARIISW